MTNRPHVRAPALAGVRSAATAPAELKTTTVLVVSEEPLQGFAMTALLESLGLSATFAESPGRAAQLLTGTDDMVAWIADRFDSDALPAAARLRAEQARLGFCLIANAIDAHVLRELLEHDAQRFAFVARRQNPGADELLAALARVARGRSVVDGSVVHRMLAGFDSHVQLDRLSPAEREVLMLLADGLRNREIARRLWKSEKTIEKHVGNVFHKLDLDRTTHPGIDRRVSAARIYLSASAALDVSPSS